MQETLLPNSLMCSQHSTCFAFMFCYALYAKTMASSQSMQYPWINSHDLRAQALGTAQNDNLLIPDGKCLASQCELLLFKPRCRVPMCLFHMCFRFSIFKFKRMIPAVQEWGFLEPAEEEIAVIVLPGLSGSHSYLCYADLWDLFELLCGLWSTGQEDAHPLVPILVLLLVILGALRLSHNQLPSFRSRPQSSWHQF